MPPFQIKICGVTTARDAVQAANCRADAIGLNFYPPSPRFVELDAAREIIDAVRGSVAKSDPSVHNLSPKMIGVFVNKTAAEVAHIAGQLDLDGVQFHGDEQYEIVPKVKQLLPDRLMLRAIRVKTLGDDGAGDSPSDSIAAAQSEIDAWASAGVDAVLLDAAVAGQFGGTGHRIDWHAVAQFKSSVPLILAGGLTAQNVAQAIRTARVSTVDVASGVESQPGQKDHALVRQFVNAAKAAFAEDSTT